MSEREHGVHMLSSPLLPDALHTGCYYHICCCFTRVSWSLGWPSPLAITCVSFLTAGIVGMGSHAQLCVRSPSQTTELIFRDRVSLCNLGYPQTHYSANQAGLGFTEIHLPLSAEGWDYECVPPCLVRESLVMARKFCIRNGRK